MATLKDLLDESGPALDAAVAVTIARGLLASMWEGPFDTPPPEEIDPADVSLELTSSGAVAVRYDSPARLTAVGALLYRCLAGGPVRLKKDAPDRMPRPLGKLRAFMGGGALPPRLEGFVHGLLEGRFADADDALDALAAVGVE